MVLALPLLPLVKLPFIIKKNPHRYQASHCLRPTGNVRLVAPPFVQDVKVIRLHADHDRRPGGRRTLFFEES